MSSRLGYLDHRRPEQPVAQGVAPAQLLDDLAVAVCLARLVSHRLVQIRVEVGSECLDGCDAACGQEVEQLFVDDLDAAAIDVPVLGVGCQRALEIVDE